MYFIRRDPYSGRVLGPRRVEEALAEKLYLDTYSANGTVEQLQAKIDSLAAVIARLLEHSGIPAETVAKVIGSDFEAANG